MRLTKCSQRLYHQPCRIIRILNGEFLLCSTFWEEFREVNRLHTRLMLGKRNRLRHSLLIRQDRQIVLFSIREVSTLHRHTTNQQGISVVWFKTKGSMTSLTCFYRKVLLVGKYHLLCLWVKQFNTCCTLLCLFADIEDTCGKLCLVTHTDETRHVRLYHHILLSHRLATQSSIIHIRSDGKSHETPCSQTFRQRKLQRHITLLVSHQCRIKEGCLLHILTELYGIILLLFLNIFFCFKNLFVIILICCSSIFLHRHHCRCRLINHIIRS